MDLGMIGLGRMGTNLVRSLTKAAQGGPPYNVDMIVLHDFARDKDHISDSCEYRLMIGAARVQPFSTPVCTAALSQRFGSPGEDDFVDKLLSALRYQFRGHQVKSSPKQDQRS